MAQYIKIRHLLIASLALLNVANADVMLKNEADIIGKWDLYAEAARIDGEKKQLMVEWDFQNGGVLQTTATDSFGRTKEFKTALKYSVVDGAIKKQSTPGREKYESCMVVEKDSKQMVLKCTYLYFFLTKK
ncbi:MAG: hypothetical protein WC782_07405 [Methylococcaceae bacterium]|jgi:hypothetical protein